MPNTGQTSITIGLLLLSHSTTLALPTNCVPGTYAGAQFCVDCFVGQYSTGSGMLYNTCTNCLPGTYAPASGASACQYCPSGTYDATSGGAVACTACSTGFGLGLTACNTCFLNAPQVLNESFVVDNSNGYVREMSLIDGSALNPSVFPSLKGSTVYPYYIMLSPDGQLVFITYNGNALYLLSAVDGSVTLMAGSYNSPGYIDGPAVNASFTGLTSGAVAQDLRTVYLLESFCIRVFDYHSRVVSTLIGSNGVSGCQAGPVPFSSAKLNMPYGIYASPSGRFLLVIDQADHVLLLVNLVNTTVSVIAGQCGGFGYADGLGPSAKFNSPRDVQVVPDESYAIVADSGNFVLRKVILGDITALLNNQGITTVSTILGTAGVSGNVNGQGTSAQIGMIYGFGLSPGGSLLYFGDWNRIKVADLSVSPVTVKTFSGNGTAGLGYGSNTMYKAPKTVRTFGCPVLCPANYYVVVGSTVCTACPPNSVSAVNASTCTANAGYYINGSTTSPITTGACFQGGQCNAGTYVQTPCTALSLPVCAPCQSGLTYSSSVNSAYCSLCTSKCPNGTYFTSACTVTANVGCTQCPQGSYASLIGQTVCKNCPIGTYSAAGASSCTMCQIGAYSLANASACTNCPAGSYTPAYSNACTICSPGSFSTTPAASCTPCQAGTYSSVSGANTTSVCISCTAGSYSVSGASVCTTCQAGSYSGAAAPSCTSCLVGTYSNTTGAITSTVCIPCTVGTYSNAPASSACTQCPTAFTTTTTGASDPSQCSICMMGASTASGVCTLCGTGTYSNSTGATACTNCSSNAFSTVGASACQTCAAGNYLYSYTIISTAAQSFGTVSYTYPNTMIPTQVGLYCSNYRSATYYAAVGTYCSDINFCPWPLNAGCYIITTNGIPNGFTCDAGCVTASSCNGVQNGILTSPGNIGDPNSCQIQCNPGYKLQNRACVLIGNCDMCPNGTYSQAGSTNCTPCTNGTFANSPGSIACRSCVSCSAGSYPANCGLTIGNCTQCPAGYYSKAGDTICTGCPLGTYSTVIGATSNTVCTQCAIGTYSSAPSSNCTLCPAGYTTVSTNTSSLSGCNTCIPGTSSATGACAFCSMGTFTQTLNSSRCSNCTSGWYSDNGASVCQACQAGKYFFSTTVASPSTPVPAATASYVPAFSPVTLVAGQYCSDYNTEYMYATSDYTTTYCNDLLDPLYPFCPWKKGSGCVELGYASWCTAQTKNCPYQYDCLAGCKTASPCTNAVGNSTYTGPGVNGNPNSCPFACNPGYILSSGQCIYTGHCADCPAGTYAPTPGSVSCANCQQCVAGFYNPGCTSTDPGACNQCKNTI